MNNSPKDSSKKYIVATSPSKKKSLIAIIEPTEEINSGLPSLEADTVFQAVGEPEDSWTNHFEVIRSVS